MSEGERRRRRPAVACTLCRRRKVRCNRETPCNNCSKGSGVQCTYDNESPLPLRRSYDRRNPSASTASRTTISTPTNSTKSRASTIPSHVSRSIEDGSIDHLIITDEAHERECEELRRQIEELKSQDLRRIQKPLEEYINPLAENDIETTTSAISGTFYVNNESRSSGQAGNISRNIMRKTRRFGQSHWLNGVIQVRELLKLMEPHLLDKTSKASSDLQSCRHLAKIIKIQRTPPWPFFQKSNLPLKPVADELVDRYFRIIEKFYRILHIPSFKRDYDRLWISDVQPQPAFLVQAKLVFAIGATTYGENFPLRASAMEWVYEAQTWISEPRFKSRLGNQYLQNNILLSIARERVDVGGELVWILAGSLLRTAIDMGLHRDPAGLPNMTVLGSEMHRRLWNTVLEINLQSSLTLGGTPLLSLNDFDTKCPGNFNDDQLTADEPVPYLENRLTDMSLTIALRKTLPERIAVVKYLNDLESGGTYEEMLELDVKLKATYKILRSSLQSLTSNAGSMLPQFETSIMNVIICRYLLCLHAPFFDSTLHETAYAFSGRVVIETSLRIWYAAFPTSSVTATPSQAGTTLPVDTDLARLMACDAGFFRVAAVQASFFIVSELRNRVKEEESLGSIHLRPDLLAVFNDAKDWFLRCIKAGETSIKGYMFMCAAGAEIEGRGRGLGKDDLAFLIGQSIGKAQEECLAILEPMAQQGSHEGAQQAYDEMALNMPLDFMEDWDFMTQDSGFSVDNVEPMNFAFGAGYM